MLVTKNTYGVTSEFNNRNFDYEKLGKCTGSSEERKPLSNEEHFERLLNRPLFPEPKKERQPRSLSRRTKSKIRNKVMAFGAIHKHLSFVTLTFVNLVDECLGVKILGKFLENVSKRSKDFQYIWVAEKQKKNTLFPDNIHFHLVTNKYWDIKRWWKYWVELQAKHGILPRDTSFSPSSAFDVRAVTGKNVKAIGNYLTKYLTKNEDQFMCQIWNCSKKISRLVTARYSDRSFIDQVKALETADLLGGKIKTFEKEYCITHVFPLNRTTLKFYTPIEDANREMWKNYDKKEVSNGLR